MIRYLNITKILLILYGLIINACAHNVKHQQHYKQHLSNHDRHIIVNIAKQAIGKPRLKNSLRNDCSGLVRAVYAQAHIKLGGIIRHYSENDVKAIYRYIKKYGRIVKDKPLPADLIFFHNTYNRSGKGHMNDALTHIGIVEKVDGPNIHFIHHLGQTIIRSRMNLDLPHHSFHPESKERINHVLRRAHAHDKAYTAAELFAGFGRL